MGLGGINADVVFQDISKEDLDEKLLVLKKRFINGSYPSLKERVERIKKLKNLMVRRTGTPIVRVSYSFTKKRS